MMATQAFYCSLCGTFAGDSACAEHHLKSAEHNEKYAVSIDGLIILLTEMTTAVP